LEPLAPAARYSPPIALEEIVVNAQKRAESLQDDLDPISLMESNVKVNASLTFGPQDGDWDIALIGKNLTDEESFTFINDVPLFGGSHNMSPQAPRSFTVRGRLHF